jgi:hypothetical protein
MRNGHYLLQHSKFSTIYPLFSHKYPSYNYSLKNFLLLCWVGVHCGIYKGSYNVSNISYSPSSPLSRFLEQFQQVSFLYLLTSVHIMCTIFILLPLSPPPLPPTSAPHPDQNLFCPPVLQFYRRKTIKDKKRNITFLLVWDKDTYTGSFLVLFPCICVLQPQLFHLFQSSSLLPNPLPTVAPPV